MSHVPSNCILSYTEGTELVTNIDEYSRQGEIQLYQSLTSNNRV